MKTNAGIQITKMNEQFKKQDEPGLHYTKDFDTFMRQDAEALRNLHYCIY